MVIADLQQIKKSRRRIHKSLHAKYNVWIPDFGALIAWLERTYLCPVLQYLTLQSTSWPAGRKKRSVNAAKPFLSREEGEQLVWIWASRASPLHLHWILPGFFYINGNKSFKGHNNIAHLSYFIIYDRFFHWFLPHVNAPGITVMYLPRIAVVMTHKPSITREVNVRCHMRLRRGSKTEAQTALRRSDKCALAGELRCLTDRGND